MIKEVELKFLEIDKDALVQKLKDAGAVLQCDGILKTIYFDYPDERIAKSDELFRIRTFGDKIELNRKINMRIEGGCKVYDEFDVYVSDFDETVRIIESLGAKPWVVFEKHRTEYALPSGGKFEIDEFPGVPVYAEIEAEDGVEIARLAKEFGLDGYETSNLTAMELIPQKYGIDTNGLKF